MRYYYQKLKGTLDDELLMLNQMVSGGCAIDIGANYGIYSYLLSKLCNQVEAFEPIPACAETLIAYSTSIFSRRNINVHTAGLSNSNGSLILHVPIINNRHIFGFASFNKPETEHVCISVPIYRLDDFNFREVSFIKIDVEGHESKVLEGAMDTLVREKPVILIEIEQRHTSGIPMTSVFSTIIALGYEGFFISRDGLRPLSHFSYETNQQPFLNNVMCKDYINNFIFKPI